MTHRLLRSTLGLGLGVIVACSATGGTDAQPGGSGASAGSGGAAAADAGLGGAGAGAGANTGGGAGTGGASGAGTGGASGAGTGGGPQASDLCGNGLDDDGNGMVDEGCACQDGATQACWSGPAQRRGVGACKDGVQACERYGEFNAWGPCVGETLPSTEIAGNGVDEDCDGSDPGGACVPTSTSEECFSGKDADCDGLMGCQDSDCATVCSCAPTEDCSNGKDDDCDGKLDCQDSDCVQAANCKPVSGCKPEFPFITELLCGDGRDNDCDGKVDCADPDCKRPGTCGCAPRETSCSDGVDEDCDGNTDCKDLDCEKCTPGQSRYCDDPTYCHWGKQKCDNNGTWGTCYETPDRPKGCSGDLYSASCCTNAGECCEDYPNSKQSIGNCAGVVKCE
ncbi:MAG: MopE-related protein [Polyangiaceae bacterium]|nr:MopE-related protein [Polyangiaceae bacterium]